ncbi:hypothetical protein OQA88_1769 [Cercophora sp. LCS_1]
MKDLIPIQLLDGGLGTSLEDRYGVKFSEATPLWSSHLLVSDQQTLLDCQTDFGDVGVDVITTATYQVSIEGFAATRTPDWTRGIDLPNIPRFLEDAVLIASKAAPAAQVALSLGPYGATMLPSTEYSGKYDDQHNDEPLLYQWHLERLMLYVKNQTGLACVSYMAFETIPRLDEVLAIRKLLVWTEWKRIMPWISCLFPGDDERLPDGSSVQEVVHAMLSCETGAVVPWGIGINCTKISKLDSLVKQYEKAVQELIDLNQLSGWPNLVLYPDGTNGEVYDTVTKTWKVPDGENPPEVSVCPNGNFFLSLLICARYAGRSN